MSKLKIITSSAVFLVLIYLGFATDFFRSNSVHDFESCIAYGNLVMESYPRQCRDRDGVSYTEEIVVVEDKGIDVSFPIDGGIVTSPISIKGEAHGKWFFEASFPVSLVDEFDNVLVQSHVTAQGDWMTEDFVPFTANVSFSVATTTKGFVVFKNDNPSGDSERDVYHRIPVTFVPRSVNPKPVVTPKCIVGGCSSELCTDASKGDMMSTCIYNPKYACYQGASCEVQNNGTCGWTETDKLRACINNAQ